MLTGLVAILIFGVLILLHELGHFLAARHCGVQVEEFSIGFGPALFSTVKNGTRYSVRILPLGGYNLLAQENGAPPEKKAEEPEKFCVGGKTFPEAGVWQRFFIIAAGVCMNFLLGFALLLVLQSTQDGVATRTVYDFLPGATSESDGLQAGDKIVAINGHHCFSWGDILYEVSAAGGQPVPVRVLRGGKRVDLPAVHISAAKDAEGNQLPMDFHLHGVEATPLTVVQGAFGNFFYYARALVRSFVDLFRGATPVSELSGPVGVVNEVQKAIQYGWQDVVSLAVLLSINLGIFNLLPIPGLDGGKLLLLAAEGVTGRRLPQRVEEAVTLAGMMALMMLMLFVTYNDIIKFL